MKIKLIGIGQCGSFVVYDVIAFLFSQRSSKDIRVAPKSQWSRDVKELVDNATAKFVAVQKRLHIYFEGLKAAEIPQFYVIDGNKNNAVIDGLRTDDLQRKLGPLQVFVKSLPLTRRNNGCSLGEIGEFVFRREKDLGSASKVFNELDLSGPSEINAFVFAASGGSGSGGIPVLNDEPRRHGSLLINMMVLPSYKASDRRQEWNTGRCIMRLATVDQQSALFLFSNLSENLRGYPET